MNEFVAKIRKFASLIVDCLKNFRHTSIRSQHLRATPDVVKVFELMPASSNDNLSDQIDEIFYTQSRALSNDLQVNRDDKAFKHVEVSSNE